MLWDQREQEGVPEDARGRASTEQPPSARSSCITHRDSREIRPKLDWSSSGSGRRACASCLCVRRPRRIRSGT
jgi:hypothetical protein